MRRHYPLIAVLVNVSVLVRSTPTTVSNVHNASSPVGFDIAPEATNHPATPATEVEVVLAKLGLSSLLPTFHANGIDQVAFALLDRDALKDLNIPLGATLKIEDYIKTMRGNIGKTPPKALTTFMSGIIAAHTMELKDKIIALEAQGRDQADAIARLKGASSAFVHHHQVETNNDTLIDVGENATSIVDHRLLSDHDEDGRVSLWIMGDDGRIAFGENKDVAVFRANDGDLAVEGDLVLGGGEVAIRGTKVLASLRYLQDGWTRFWWYRGDLPGAAGAFASEGDVLAHAFSHDRCDAAAAHCFQRLPPHLVEGCTELLAVDASGAAVRWAFDPDNAVAHAAWLAFHGHQEVAAGAVLNHGDAWSGEALDPARGGTGAQRACDSFMYRAEGGVASVLLDDDNCACWSCLEMGYGMCSGAGTAGHGFAGNAASGPGVDDLLDAACDLTSLPEATGKTLELYFRDTCAARLGAEAAGGAVGYFSRVGEPFDAADCDEITVQGAGFALSNGVYARSDATDVTTGNQHLRRKWCKDGRCAESVFNLYDNYGWGIQSTSGGTPHHRYYNPGATGGTVLPFTVVRDEGSDQHYAGVRPMARFYCSRLVRARVAGDLAVEGKFFVGENKHDEVTVVRYGTFYVHYLSFWVTGATPKKWKVFPAHGMYAYWSADVNKFSFQMTNSGLPNKYEVGHYFGHTCWNAAYTSRFSDGVNCPTCGELHVRKTVLKPGNDNANCGSGGNYMVLVKTAGSGGSLGEGQIIITSTKKLTISDASDECTPTCCKAVTGNCGGEGDNY